MSTLQIPLAEKRSGRTKLKRVCTITALVAGLTVALNAMTLQPFLNYNLPKGWYLTSSPLITANWEADDDNRWTVPIGGGIGRIFKIGHQAINANIAAYYNVVTPDNTGANWQLRAEWTFLFPTH